MAMNYAAPRATELTLVNSVASTIGGTAGNQWPPGGEAAEAVVKSMTVLRWAVEAARNQGVTLTNGDGVVAGLLRIGSGSARFLCILGGGSRVSRWSRATVRQFRMCCSIR